MEISKIVIENFKGIEHVELSPVKQINVLIGRNNSGKSSVLTCLNFLHEYFSPNNTSKTIHVPPGYFREGLDNKPELSISISVKQSKEERKKQFICVKNAWNPRYPIHIVDAAINAQLDNDLFSSLTYKFAALPPQGNFGLLSINTKSSKNKEDATDIIIAESEHKSPGNRMLGLPLPQLLTTRQRQGDYPKILDLARKHDIGSDFRIGGGGEKTLTGKPSEFIINVLSPAYEYIIKMFYTAFLLNPYRHGEIVVQAQRSTVLEEDGTIIVAYM